MQPIQTPYWDDLIFSINSEQLSTKHHPLPWIKYLRVSICEHSTGNKAVIPDYPCKMGHSPSIEELLVYLVEKSKIYSEALASSITPHCYLLKKYNLKDAGQGLLVYLHTKSCFRALCDLLQGTGVDVETLAIILDKQL